MRRRLLELGQLSEALLTRERPRAREVARPERERLRDIGRVGAEVSASRRRGRPLSPEHRSKIAAYWARRRRFGLPE